MSMLAVKLVLAVVLLTLLLLIFPLVRPSHWWKKVNAADVSRDNVTLMNSSVYQSVDGNWLVLLKEARSDEGVPYIIFPKTNEVGLPNRNSLFSFGRYVYCRDTPPHVILMNSVKADSEPGLLVKPGYIEFITTKKVRIRVTL